MRSVCGDHGVMRSPAVSHALAKLVLMRRRLELFKCLERCIQLPSDPAQFTIGLLDYRPQLGKPAPCSRAQIYLLFRPRLVDSGLRHQGIYLQLQLPDLVDVLQRSFGNEHHTTKIQQDHHPVGHFDLPSRHPLLSRERITSTQQ